MLSDSLANASENQSTVKAFEAEINQLQDEINDKELNLNSIQQAFESQKIFLQEKMTESDELSKQVDEITAELKQVKNALEGEQKAKVEAQEKLKNFEVERNEIIAKIKLEKTLFKEHIQTEIDEIVEKNKIFAEEIEDKNNQYGIFRLEELRKIVEIKENLWKEAQEIVANKNEELTEKNEGFENLSKLNKKLGEIIRENKKQIDLEINAKGEIESKLEACEKELVECLAKLEGIETDKKKLSSELKKKIEETESLSAQIQNL